LSVIEKLNQTNQTFFRRNGYVYRNITVNGNKFTTRVKSSNPNICGLRDYFRSSLDSPVRYSSSDDCKVVNYIDLFSGGGGLSLGVHQALKAMGFAPQLAAACDLDSAALSLIKKHFHPFIVKNSSVDDLIRYDVSPSGRKADFLAPPRFIDHEFESLKGEIDLLIGGPPCQGHSNLNNHTRRDDVRNRLYYVMPAMAVALDIPVVVIENVRHIVRAHEDVVGNTKKIFSTHGYNCEEIILHAVDYGVAQTRQRHFLIASKKDAPLNISGIAESLKTDTLTYNNINGKLKKLGYKHSLLESVPEYSEDNLMRMEALIGEGHRDLPLYLRPDCHKDGTTYKSVYGKIDPNAPASTITTGFVSPGRGRYTHPTKPRTINIREAARIQSFPDWYWDVEPDMQLMRGNYTKIVGDAVPPLLIHPIMFALFDHFSN